MTAATTAIEISEASAEKQESCLYYALKANTTIPAGTLAMVVQGNGYAEPYVGNTANAVVLGVSAAESQPAHPELVAELKSEAEADRKAKYDALSDFVKNGS